MILKFLIVHRFNIRIVLYDTPTREENLLDIVLTTNATLVKSSTNIPGLADHDIIITDAIIKPTYNKNDGHIIPDDVWAVGISR
jgi:hypothetical protein